MSDITGLLHAEPQVPGADAAELWRTVAMNLPDSIVAVDREGVILWINRTLTPYNMSDVVGRQCMSFLTPASRAFYSDALAAVFHGRMSDTYEVETIDGRWWLTRGVPLPVTEGSVQVAILISNEITQRKHAEQALGEKEQLFRLIADTSPAVMFIFDHVAKSVVYVNSGVENFLGYTPEEILGLRENFVATAIYPDDIPRVAEHVKALKAMSDGDVRTIEYRLIRRDGQIRWAVSRTTPFQRLQDGSLLHTLCATVDITDHKNVQADPTEQRRMLDHVIQSLPAVTVVWDLQAERPLYVNGQCEELFGCSADELLARDESGSAGSRVFTGELVAALLSARTAADGATVDVEHEVAHPSGRRRFVLSRTSVMRREANGEPRLLIGLLLDVTDRREAENRLQASEARLRSVMAHAPDLIARLDVRGNITFINRPYPGMECVQNVVASGFAWVVPEDAHLLRNAITSVFEEARTAKARLRVRLRTGEVSTFDCRFGPIIMGDVVESAIAIAHDVTAEILAAEEIRRKDAQLARAMELSTSAGMVAGISHEVGQPIYSIANFAAAALQLMTSRAEPDLHLIEEWLEKIREQAVRAGDIIRDLRDVVRSGEPLREVVNLNVMVREGLRLCESHLRQSALRVQVNEAPEAVWCSLDRIQFEQVLVNLLRNAADAMDGCEAADREIRIAVHGGDAEGKISIMDRGTGLPSGRERMIFEPFFTTKPRGLGLGLAICRNVISSHAGRLWAENNVGSGATFHITLPLRGAK